MKSLLQVGVLFLVFGVFNWGASNAYLRVSLSEVERANQHNFAFQAAILGPIATVTVVRYTDFLKHGWQLW